MASTSENESAAGNAESATILSCGLSDKVTHITCGPHQNYHHEKCVLPLQQCRKSITNHLVGVKLPRSEAASEWQLIAARAGYAGCTDDQILDQLTVCPAHRYRLGLKWVPSRACKHPLHKGSKNLSIAFVPKCHQKSTRYGILMFLLAQVCDYFIIYYVLS